MSSIKIRTKRLEGNTQIRTLITHPMENGRNKDAQGIYIPAHYIKELLIEHNSHLIIRCNMAGSISKNPYFDFLLKDGKIGDTVTVTWKDNLGATDSEEYIIE